MKRSHVALLLLLGGFAVRMSAHRVDEYLQYTLVSLERNQVKADLYLTPGISVLPTVLAVIDGNVDGVVSDSERRAYAQRVLADLTLSLDGHRLAPRLTTVEFPAAEDLAEGRGDIHVQFEADLPAAGSTRKLRLENRHQASIAAYQVNGLIPRDPDIRIVAQLRDESQSSYEVEYTQAGGLTASRQALPWAWAGSGVGGLLFSAWWRGARKRNES